MSSGVPFGMVTPREAIKEQVRAWKKEAGTEFKVKRFRQIFRHLDKCGLLDVPMKASWYEATIKEAYAMLLENEKHSIGDFMRSLPAQGSA